MLCKISTCAHQNMQYHYSIHTYAYRLINAMQNALKTRQPPLLLPLIIHQLHSNIALKENTYPQSPNPHLTWDVEVVQEYSQLVGRHDGAMQVTVAVRDCREH
jgi:hypothetical protein